MRLWTKFKLALFAGMTITMMWHWQVEEAKAEPFPVIVATDSTAAPAEEIFFAERIPSGHWVDMGTFKTTGYCNCRKCAGKWAGGKTTSGVYPVEGETIAVDRSVIPLGSMVMVDGHIYWAQDTGVRGKHIDVYYDIHSVAWNHGVKRQHVFVWRED
jgi:3D (Asp-Asp-Asp) domain-containing protein